MSHPLAKKIPRNEIEGMADMMAKNARLDRPLPPDTDFTNEEMTEIQTQLKALAILPADALEPLYLAFSAKHLPALASALRTLSSTTQRKALSTLIQILSLIPDPLRNPYFRKFLRTSRFQGLPTLIASSFVSGIDWLRPSGPGYISELIIHTLFWCDVTTGDDKKASVDKEVRTALAGKLKELISGPDFSRLDERQQADMERLAGILDCVDDMPEPPGYYLLSTQEHLQGQITGQEECDVCMEEENLMACSKCKTVKYCSTECQTKAWKKGHKQRCFTAAY